MRRLGLLVLCSLVVACTAAPSPSDLGPSERPGGATPTPVAGLVDKAVEDVARDGTFELHLSAPRATVPAGLPVTPITTITYVGPAAAITFGSSDPAVVFSVEQLDGPHHAGGGASDVCASTTLQRGVPDNVPFGKVGGFSDDEPDAAWLRAYFMDPLLHLPAGSWRITAELEAFVPSCGGLKHRLRASIVVAITD